MPGVNQTNNAVIKTIPAAVRDQSEVISLVWSERYPGVSDTNLIIWFDSLDPLSSASQWRDLSGNNHNANQATASEQPVIIVDPNYGNVYDFDGIDDNMIISANANLELIGDLTILAWCFVDTDVLGVNRGILYKGQRFVSWGLDLGADTVILYQIRSMNPVFSADPKTLTKGVWMQVGFAFNDTNDTMKIYYNGFQKGSTYIETGSIANSNETLYIGRDIAHQTSNIMDGKIAQIMVFNRELSSSDITSLYNTDKGAFGL